MSFLAIEDLHAFVTGAQGGIGKQIVKELVGTPRRIRHTSSSSSKILIPIPSKRLQSNSPRSPPPSNPDNQPLHLRNPRQHLRRILHLRLHPPSNNPLRPHQHPLRQRRNHKRTIPPRNLGPPFRNLGIRLRRQRPRNVPHHQTFPPRRDQNPARNSLRTPQPRHRHHRLGMREIRPSRPRRVRERQSRLAIRSRPHCEERNRPNKFPSAH